MQGTTLLVLEESLMVLVWRIKGEAHGHEHLFTCTRTSRSCTLLGIALQGANQATRHLDRSAPVVGARSGETCSSAPSEVGNGSSVICEDSSQTSGQQEICRAIAFRCKCQSWKDELSTGGQ
jgi:hypothetical protein